MIISHFDSSSLYPTHPLHLIRIPSRFLLGPGQPLCYRAWQSHKIHQWERSIFESLAMGGIIVCFSWEEESERVMDCSMFGVQMWTHSLGKISFTQDEFCAPKKEINEIEEKDLGVQRSPLIFLPLLPAGYFAINRPAREKYSKQSIYISNYLKGQLGPPVGNVTFFNHGGRLEGVKVKCFVTTTLNPVWIAWNTCPLHESKYPCPMIC